MSRSLNKVILIGNVGSDPEVRTVGNGKVASFSLATRRQWTDQSGRKQEKTEWHRIVAWSNGGKSGLADVASQYVKKGDKVYIEGEIEYRQYTDKDGAVRYTTEIKAKELLLLGSKGTQAAPPSMGRGRAAPRARAAARDDFDDRFPGLGPDVEDVGF
jgi:single-strand DNA-binding protein